MSQGGFEMEDRWAPGPDSWCLSNGAELKFCPKSAKKGARFPSSIDMVGMN